MNDTQELNEFLNDLHESDGYYMKNEINLIELQNKIHAQNLEMGWWSEERPFSTFVCLFHSELSEAMEGDRKGLMDDHLPKYPMFQVELADFVIRCLDYLGSRGLTDAEWGSPYIQELPEDRALLIAHLHCNISSAFTARLDSDEVEVDFQLMDAVTTAFNYASPRFDLHQIILEKVEYNKHRADHKKENREKPGGKKY